MFNFYLLFPVEDLQHQRGAGAGSDLPGPEQQEQQHDRLAEKGQSSPLEIPGELKLFPDKMQMHLCDWAGCVESLQTQHSAKSSGPTWWRREGDNWPDLG